MLKRKLGKFISFFFPGLIWKKKAISQNDNKESEALLHYAEELKINKSFIEFGFGPFQYNSIGLTKRHYKGLLIDGTKLSCDQGNKNTTYHSETPAWASLCRTPRLCRNRSFGSTGSQIDWSV